MSTKPLVIVGAGGFAREVLWLVEEINKETSHWEVEGFIDDNPVKKGLYIDGLPILGGYEWFDKNQKPIHIVFAVGNPVGRKLLVERFKGIYRGEYPNLIHPSVKLSCRVDIGAGNILCASTLLTTNIRIGNFNIINLNCTIGHDAVIKDFCTLAPAVNVSGNVTLYDGCDLGTNCCIIQEKSVGPWAVIGAGSVVIRDIDSHCTAVGAPARPIKYHRIEEGDLL